MTDPITALTVGAITQLAFTKFLESAAGEAAKTFTTSALTKMDELRKQIVTRLQGNGPVETAVKKLEAGAGDETDLETVSDYLKIAMREDPTFAEALKGLAQEINIGKIQDNSSVTQNVDRQSIGIAKVESGGQVTISPTYNYNSPND